MQGWTNKYKAYKHFIKSIFYSIKDLGRQPRNQSSTRQTQLLLKLFYKNTNDRYKLDDVGFRQFSQFDEDGRLLYIFSVIGEGGKRVLEISAGIGRESMSANLIINHGWEGLLFEGDPKKANEAISFFSWNLDVYRPPKVLSQWITAENINQLVFDGGFKGDIDLLSIDVDGNDLWFWKALEVVSPRVCIVESNAAIPNGNSLVSKYDPNFVMKDACHSASIDALVKLAKEKGYRLVGSNNVGFNLIFIRNDVGMDHFPEIAKEYIHDNRWVKEGQKTKWPSREGLDWEIY